MSAPIDLSLYLVTDRRLASARGVVATVRAALAGGVTAVQLRDPDATGRDLYAAARELRDVVAGSGVPLIIDDRLDVALAAGADGVHLGQSDLPADRARELAGPHFLIGGSAGDGDELAAADALPAGTFDYVGIGPAFATSTKMDAGAPLGVDGLARLAAATPLPTVAIGGISKENAAAVAATGVDGLSVVSAICAAADPEEAARTLRDLVRT
ncbi:MAG: thiamine phosphate synthase [Streptosporangiales bacterium]